MCGDGILVPGEECDDGNTAEGDGCGPTCLTEHPEVCPGTPIDLAKGQTMVIAGNTSGASDKFKDSPAGKGNCLNGTWPGSDLIYAVTPAAAGTLTATLAANYGSPYVHVRTKCPGGKADEIACQYSAGGSNTVTIQASMAVTYYVAADSYGNQSGAFTLTLSLQ